MAPSNSFPFRRALVTGASSGIGEAMSRQLLQAGVPVVAVARRRERLEQLRSHGEVEVLAADLGQADGVAAVAQRIAADAAPVDLVVNNAGFGTSGWFHEQDPNRFAAEVDLNITALTRLAHAALATMIPRGRGYLMNVSSVASFQPGPKLAVYSATKAYVTSLTEALHEECRGTGVKVTALCPGLTKTEFQSISNTQGYETQFPALAWTDVEMVARTGLADVARGRALSVPGVVYKTLVSTSQVTPGFVARRLGGLVMKRR